MAKEDGGQSVFHKRQEELEKYEFMMGTRRGRLAVTLDLLTEAMVLVGQHAVYCRSARAPEPGKPESGKPDQPPMDVRLINQGLGQAKELIQSVMEELRAEREQPATE